MSTATDDTLNVLFAPYGVDAEGNAFPPHPTQQKILDWVHAIRSGELKTQGIPVLYLQHGVDSGGTRAVMAPVLECLFEHPGIRVLDGRKDFNDLRLSAMETFFEIMPRELIAGRDEQEHRYTIRAAGGESQIFFRELKDVKGLGSQEFAIIVVHEAHEIDEPQYRTLKQRCRQAGYPLMILMEGNPPSHGHWLERIVDPKHKDFDADITRIILSSFENWKHMTPQYRHSLETMPDAWKRRYLLGEAATLPSGSAVYPAFVESVHVQETHVIPDRPGIRFWDFGFRRPACLWAQMDDLGRLLVHKEWMPFETPEDEFIQGVVVRTNAFFGQRPMRDFGDPAATQRDKEGISTIARLQAQKIQLYFRQTTYGERIPLVNKKLSELISGVPAVIVNPACQTLIEGLAGGYHYQELKEGQSFGLSKDLPYRDGHFEHLCNAFEYGIVNLFGGASSNSITASIVKQKNRIRQMSRTQGTSVF